MWCNGASEKGEGIAEVRRWSNCEKEENQQRWVSEQEMGKVKKTKAQWISCSHHRHKVTGKLNKVKLVELMCDLQSDAITSMLLYWFIKYTFRKLF